MTVTSEPVAHDSPAAVASAASPGGYPPVSVIILSCNEENNIAHCLRSCAWSDDVHVVDSGSTDRTREIAIGLGASVHQHEFHSFGQQRNWAIDNIPHKHDWVFHLDADERFTPQLVEEMRQLLEQNPAEAGFYVPHKLMFMGRWLKYSEGYPIYQMRLFHKGRMRFRDYGHGQREDTVGNVGRLTQPYIHYNFSKGISDWLDRHNRYSTLEAQAIVAGQQGGGAVVRGSLLGGAVQRRRFLKARVYPKTPAKWVWRFLYMYFLKMGFMDGLAGLQYCLLMSSYELFTGLKVRELRRRAEDAAEETPSAPLDAVASPLFDKNAPSRHNAVSNTSRDGGESIPLARERNTSPWTTREKLGRVAWMIAGKLLFRPSFHNWYGWRRMLLRLFGARIGLGVRVRPTAHIEIPWNLDIGEHAAIGDYAILYSLGPIKIGRLAVVSQYAHLCAGTHDYTDPRFPLLCPPIVVGDEAWIAADAFVGPGVTVGARSVVGARSTVIKDVPPGQVVVGNPAHCVKQRELRK